MQFENDHPMKLGIALICVSWLFRLSEGQSGGRITANFVTLDDRLLARKAKEKVETACAEDVVFEDLTSEDYEARREDLVKASADNIILTVLKESSDPTEMEAQVSEKIINPGFLLFQAGPLIAFIFFLILYLVYFCWAPCPCCWCSCCRRKRHCNIIVKVIFMLLLAGIILGLVIAAALSMRGFSAASSGFKLTQCTAAQLVNDTMGGSPEQNFLGVIRTLEIFEELKDSLDPGSRFLTDLEGILTDTKGISDAVMVASATMTNLQSMMEDPANQAPMSTGGEDLKHTCRLCSELAPTLAEAVTALNTGVGSALASTREVVAEQLQGDNLQKLSDSMLSGTAPLVELKTIIHAAFGPFVEQDTLEAVTEQLDSVGTLSSVALIGVALLLAGCSILTGVCWICVETSKDSDGVKQHRRTTCRCALCTWCCGCYYMLFVLLISGIMTAASIPLSSICLVMEDVDGQLINDIAAPLELNISGPEGAMMIDMVTQCFRNPDPMANPRLLDLITVPGTDGTGTMTMYELIVGQTKTEVNGQFDALTQQLDTGDVSLWNNDSPVKKLSDQLGSTPMASMILFDTANHGTDSQFAALAGSSLSDYMLSGGGCADLPIASDAGYGDLDGQTVKGVSPFGLALRGLGSADAGSPTTCSPPTGKADCTGSGEAAACAAGNNLMDLKLKLRTGNIFKCWRFWKNGAECMVDAQVGLGPGGSNGCMVNGALDSRSYDCDIDEFTSKIQTYYSAALRSTFQDLDAKTNSLKDTISADLKILVDNQVMRKITTVADGLTCGFLGNAYQGVLDGLCYGGVWGFQAMSASYVACGVLTILLVILTFIVWRISYDNVLMNSKDPITKYEG